jgi:hypothetical protein
MGCYSSNYLPPGTRLKTVDEFLRLLGYESIRKVRNRGNRARTYYFYRDDDYKYTTGILARLSEDPQKKCLVVETSTSAWRSKFDSDFHNYTVKQVRARFGGYFVSDYGENRLLKYDGPVREKAEAGLYKAFASFHSNLQRVRIFNSHTSFLAPFDRKYETSVTTDVIGSLDPRVVAANLAVPFIVAALEGFFRSAYIALLLYSPKREKIFRGAKLRPNELDGIERGDYSASEAVAKWMSFQDMNQVSVAFKEVEPGLDIHGILKRPHGGRRGSFWEPLVRIIAQRHRLIHEADLKLGYHPQSLSKDVDLAEKSVKCVYNRLIDLRGWHRVEDWEF